MAESPTLGQALRDVGRVLILIRPYWGGLTKGLLLALVVAGVGMAVPYLTKLLIDEVYPTGNGTLMQVLVGGILAFSITSRALAALGGYFTLWVNTRMSNATRLMFFNHLQHLRMRFFDRHQVGEVSSRFQDVGRALDSISEALQIVFVQGMYLLLVPPILLLLEWRLALVAMVTVPLTLLAAVAAGPFLRRHWQRASEAFAELNAYQIEVLSHIRTFKSMGLEHRVYDRARGQVETAMGHQLRAGGVTHLFGSLHGVLDAVGTALFTWLGWKLILSRQMTLGDFIAFTAYVGFLQGPLHQLIQLFSDFQQTAVHLSRMFEYLDEDTEENPEKAYEAPPEVRQPLRGGYRLEGVRFGYDPSRPVLSGLDLEIAPASTTAIVGPSGSGKTSLLLLLAGLEEPDAGSIQLDGRPAHGLPVSEVRRQIGTVWQEISLVRGTIWQNLTLGVEEPDRFLVDRAVEICGLKNLVADLPRGYETEVAEGGSSLSAGQRQRLALARALLRPVPILLLDEATANIDVGTETKILRRLLEACADRTLIYVTHRVATAALADRVCVLDHGRVVGHGSHRGLLQGCALYREMVEESSATSAAGPMRLVGDAAVPG